LENALPILERNRFSATCYVTSSRTNLYNEWDASILNARKPLMNDVQILAWKAAGMEVGAHSRTHPHLPSCTDAELHEQIGGCKSDLESLIGAPVTQFCYPYGDVDGRVAETVRKAGFVAATLTQRGRARPYDDPLMLRRVLVSGSTLPHLFVMKLLTAYEDRRG
jgi:peptidoglycan/xylan/chitin deacetylase (PgdA/CDA1 family)